MAPTFEWVNSGICRQLYPMNALENIRFRKREIEKGRETETASLTLVWFLASASNLCIAHLKGHLILILTLSLPSSKSTFSQPFKYIYISYVVRISSIIIFNLSNLEWKAKFSILSGVIFLVRLQGNLKLIRPRAWAQSDRTLNRVSISQIWHCGKANNLGRLLYRRVISASSPLMVDSVHKRTWETCSEKKCAAAKVAFRTSSRLCWTVRRWGPVRLDLGGTRLCFLARVERVCW